MKTFDEHRYDKMPYRKCGRWGLKLPAISLGAWETFGGYRGEEVARECMYRAFDLGITHFDLANNYGRPAGNAEVVVGHVAKDMPRDEIIISTKAGYQMWGGPYGEWGSRKYLIASVDQSLKRLGLDYVDIFYSHRPDPDTPLEETIGALEQIVKSGKALYAGISNYPGAMAAESCDLVERKNWSPITIHQPSYNMLGRDIEKDVVPAARKHGFGIIAFSPLAHGLLTSKYLNGVPADSRAATDFWSGEGVRKRLESHEVVEKVRKLNDVAATRGQSLAQMALAWILRLPEITSALIGASKVTQIEENVKALEKLEFSAEELQRIEDILK
jgi:L-glyceraldehyde 3-phosphate reductase